MLIAEIGVNHLGSVDMAKRMIDAGLAVGVKTFKFQIYKIDELGESQDWKWYDYMNYCALDEDQYLKIKQFCEEAGATFFASVFGDWSFNLAQSIDMSMFKIASRSLYDKHGNISELAKQIIATQKPVIASLGYSRDGYPMPQHPSIKYLYCVSKYPTLMSDIHWPTDFNGPIHGFSDHTIGTEAALEAIRLGAAIIEKHFTIDRNLFGPDQSGSANPEEMKTILRALHAVHN